MSPTPCATSIHASWSPRRPDPLDGRRTLVELTAAGSSMLERLDLVLDEVRTEVFAGLTVDQRRTLLNLLPQLS